MGLHTPCAGLRPGAADPTAQQSCVPATAPSLVKESSGRVPGDVFRAFWWYWVGFGSFLEVLGGFGMVLGGFQTEIGGK